MSYEIYNTIDDCPIWNWMKCMDHNDFRYLLKLKDYNNLPDYDPKVLSDLFDKLNTEKLDELGYSKELLNTLYKRRNFEKTKLQYVLTSAYLDKLQYLPFDSDISVEYIAKLKEFKCNFKPQETQLLHLEQVGHQFKVNERKLNRIGEMARELNKPQPKTKDSDLRKVAAALTGRFPNVDFNPKRCSMADWYTYINIANE